MSILFYEDANGIQHESYEAACAYYGCDTPAQLEQEEAYWAELEEAEHFDKLCNDALLFSPVHAKFLLSVYADEIPF